ncbi:MAG: hypothetical protein HC895_11840 [Leptolyngbyaceae cyanobacterium SM1_3_5]|nr:hypothetical protein [Leptolyngbyaceae cyanobacterium SM1_3_5]
MYSDLARLAIDKTIAKRPSANDATAIELSCAKQADGKQRSCGASSDRHQPIETENEVLRQASADLVGQKSAAPQNPISTSIGVRPMQDVR